MTIHHWWACSVYAVRSVLRLQGHSTDLLFDALLPEEARVLPGELARLDELLSDPALLGLFTEHWENSGAVGRGRPTIPMATYLRVMVLKHRTGFGYETLMRAVADSLHLRRFCRIPLSESVPDESTVRKLTRRLGAELTDELIRSVIEQALADKRFRPRAMRVDSTVAAADIRYPTDSGLAGDAVRVLARAGRKVRAAVPAVQVRVRDRSRAVGRRLRALTRTLRRRSGEAKADIQRLTEETAAQVKASVREAEHLLRQARRSRSRAIGISRQARATAIASLAEIIGLARRIVTQIAMRFAGTKIPNRLVSLFDPDARPIRRGKLDKPNEFGYIVQFAEVTANTKRGARGILLPPKLEAGSTPENALLPSTVAELKRLGIKLKEASFDAGFNRDKTEPLLDGVNVFIAGSPDNAGSKRTRRRLLRYRVGAEGRISHLKRQYGAGRSRLKGTQGARIWEGWSTLAYNLDTIANMKPPNKTRPPDHQETTTVR